MSGPQKHALERRLRLRFTLLATLAAFLLLGTTDSVVLLHSYRQIENKADHLLEVIRTAPDSPELGDARYFTVTLSPAARAASVDLSHTTLVQEKQALRMGWQAREKAADTGFLEGYRYLTVREPGVIRIYFLSRKLPLEDFQAVGKHILVFSGAGIGLSALILFLLSRKVVAPLVEAQEKQKQFITSASHALKTPVAVILGDAQLLQMELVDNEWLCDIEKQAKRLTEMTRSLVTLSRCDEEARQESYLLFPISDMAEDAATSFRSIAEMGNRSFRVSIVPGLACCGDEKALREMLTILLDNATRYCPEQGEILFSLERKHRQLHLTVENTAQNVAPEEVARFTDRFYRGTTSEHIPGSGLGLAIALSIVQQHGGKLTVSAPTRDRILVHVVL